MSLAATSNLFCGILLIVLAACIATPAWTRWTRNLSLVHKGIKVTGYYQGHCQVVFRLPSGKRMRFSTWRRAVWKCSLGDELPVLYDPDEPSRAEVMKEQALWGQPLANLTQAATSVFLAFSLFQNINFGVALLLSLTMSLALYPLARLALYLLYPASRLQQFRRAHGALVCSPKGYTRQHYEWLEQREKLIKPLPKSEKQFQTESKPASKGAVPASLRPYMARGRAARAQILQDMIDIPADLNQ